MSEIDAIKAKVGEAALLHIENEAEKEVALAMQMELRDEIQRDRYYRPRSLLVEFRSELESFEAAGIKISPMDLISILFKCKLRFACKTSTEFGQRCGGSFPILVDPALVIRWEEDRDNVDALVNRHVLQLRASARERTLLSTINGISALSGDTNHQISFEKLLASVGLPFVCFFDGDHLLKKHKQLEPGLISDDIDRAREFFDAPSIGFKKSGSREYCFWYSAAWLRTLLNVLRVANYIHPGQINFGWPDVQMTPPKYPVFLGEHSKGFYKWDEDMSQSWAKIPDGCFCLSFGFRGLARAWFDRRNLPKIEEFLKGNRKIFECLSNPWSIRSTRDVAPTLDILSSATQIPDVGAKILLTYCCLEHLFVPRNAKSENKKYIVGGMNAIAPHLLPWFDQLYNLRCDYAHKGFVQRDGSTMKLIMDSMNNVMSLLVAKLSVS
jgi:hypothetical protein